MVTKLTLPSKENAVQEKVNEIIDNLGGGYSAGTGIDISNNTISVDNTVAMKTDIPAPVTETTVSGWGFTKNTGTVTSVNNTLPDANGNVTITIPDSATWGNITGTLSNQTDLNNALNAKQGTISDLSTIRSGAALGATAVQPSSLATVATTGAYSDLSGTPTVDQTYDGTSTNAQSGLAVAEALSSVSVSKDNLSITENANNQLQTVGVIDQNDTTQAIKTWTGTLAQYNAIATKDSATLYNITDDTAGGSSVYTKTEVDELLDNKVDTDLSNLNATGKAIIDKITDYPKRYFVKGLIANSSNGNFLGHGQANVVLYASGLAEIHFEFQTTTAGSNSSNFSWGVNRNMLHNLNNNIPVIIPQYGGSIQFYTSGGSINTSLEGYAGSAYKAGQFWLLARIYTTSGELGGWPETGMTVGTRVVGVVYGTFTV